MGTGGSKGVQKPPWSQNFRLRRCFGSIFLSVLVFWVEIFTCGAVLSLLFYQFWCSKTKFFSEFAFVSSFWSNLSYISQFLHKIEHFCCNKYSEISQLLIQKFTSKVYVRLRHPKWKFQNFLNWAWQGTSQRLKLCPPPPEPATVPIYDCDEILSQK